MSISFRHIGRILNAGSSGGVSPGVSEVVWGSTSQIVVAAAGNSDLSLLSPVDGVLSAAEVSTVTGLAADDTNYLTHLLLNLGQDGLGATNLYSTDNANTTKATGGAAWTAYVPRDIVLSSTPADLVVAKGDRLTIRHTKTGTLAAQQNGVHTLLTFTPSA